MTSASEGHHTPVLHESWTDHIPTSTGNGEPVRRIGLFKERAELKKHDAL